MRNARDIVSHAIYRGGQAQKGRVRGWILPMILLFGPGLAGALHSVHLGGSIDWASGHASSLERAQQSQRPILISVHSPGCSWCARMDEETFADRQIVALSHRFICTRLDSEVDGAQIARYGIAAYPTTLLIDSKGNVLARLTGFTPAERLAPVLRAVLRGSHS